jgi:hypothetical protein
MSKNKQPHLPDFIGIGSQRCGTSWLYRRLGEHPDLWLPPIKEIHFFDYLDATANTRKRKFYKDIRQRYHAYTSPKSVPKVKQPNLVWDINYFLRAKNMIWYSSLFLQGKDKITGEITPEYMLLSKDIVEKIYVLNPCMKIIFTMRDPIDRVWSATVRHFKTNNKRNMQDISEEELLNFVKRRSTILRSNYLRTLSVWESVFSAEQIHIDFFDNIQNDPEKVLLHIFDFLEVEASTKYMLVDLQKKVASSTQKAKMDMPFALKYEVCQQNIDQLMKLSERFGGHTTKWLERAGRILDGEE